MEVSFLASSVEASRSSISLGFCIWQTMSPSQLDKRNAGCTMQNMGPDLQESACVYKVPQNPAALLLACYKSAADLSRHQPADPSADGCTKKLWQHSPTWPKRPRPGLSCGYLENLINQALILQDSHVAGALEGLHAHSTPQPACHWHLTSSLYHIQQHITFMSRKRVTEVARPGPNQADWRNMPCVGVLIRSQAQHLLERILCPPPPSLDFLWYS